MNILTKNRILQKGDQYRNNDPASNGLWHDVPENDYGLQIMFTKYTEVRRPSEKAWNPTTDGQFPTLTPDKVLNKLRPKAFPVSQPTPSNDSHPVWKHAKAQPSEGVKRSPSPDNPESGRETVLPKPIGRIPDCIPPTPISPDSGKSVKAAPVAKAEKETTPAPTPSGAGETLNVKAKLVPMTPEQIAIQDKEIIDNIPAGQPLLDYQQAAIDREIARQPKLIPVAEKATYDHTGKAPFPPQPPKPPSHLNIIYPKENDCIWTGRNGSFYSVGLDAMSLDDKVMLFPIGKRGVGNCTIQFPISVIPKLVDWLNDQHKGTPK